MYILFYPLKFPSTPVLILLKSCNTTAIFFCGPEQELNLHSPVSIANTYGHVLILYPTFGSSRVCYSSLLDNLYYTPPLFRGRLYHLSTRPYGREDRTRTCDPWFGLYIRFELMILPLLYRLTNFSAYWLTVTKTSVLAN